MKLYDIVITDQLPFRSIGSDILYPLPVKSRIWQGKQNTTNNPHDWNTSHGIYSKFSL